MQISILVALYNPPIEYLNSKLHNLISELENKIDFEIIIRDDSDKKNLVMRSPFINYKLNKKKLGIYRNYNNLLNLANGSYICFYDQDDYFSPDYFIEGVKYLSNNDHIGLYFGKCMVLSSVDGSVIRYELDIDVNCSTKKQMILSIIGGGQSLWMHSIIKNDQRYRFFNIIGADHVFNLLTIINLEAYGSPRCYFHYYEEPRKLHANSVKWDMQSSEVEFILRLCSITYSEVSVWLSLILFLKLARGHKKLIVAAVISQIRKVFMKRI